MQKTLVLTFVALVVLGVLFVLSQDADAPDDQHLVLEQDPTPADANGFFILAELLDQMDWPEDDTGIQEIPRSEIAQSEEVLNWLDKNRTLLERLPDVVAAPEFRAPVSTELEPPAFLSRGRQLGCVVALASAVRMQRAEETAAFDLVFQYLAIGHRFHHTGELLYYLIGTSYETFALQQLVQLAAESTGAGLEAVARRVSDYAWDRDGMEDALRREYMFMTATIDQPMQRLGGWKDVPGFGAYLYHPNRTRSLFAESFNDALAGLNDDCSIAALESEPIAMPKWAYLAPNSIGRILHAVGSPNLARFTYSRCREQMSTGLTALVLALYAHRVREGELPRTLDELVPEYLDALPVDVDGRGFRYSATEAYLYSVGEDRLDRGGGEPSFWVDWSAPDPGVSLRAP